MPQLMSPYDFLTAKSLARVDQIDMIKQFEEFQVSFETKDALRKRFKEVVPFSPDLPQNSLMHYWAAAILLSDIACIPNADRRAALIGDFRELCVDLGLEYGAVSLLTGQADWALSALEHS